MSVIQINCMGLKCPRPIIEMAKLARKSAPGTEVVIVADDLAFESDIRAWCETAGANLLEISKDGLKVTARVRLKEQV